MRTMQIKDFEKLVRESLWELIKDLKLRSHVDKLLKEDDEMRLLFSCIPDHVTFRVFDHQDEDGLVIVSDNEWKKNAG
jgi:hypothetical protein